MYSHYYVICCFVHKTGEQTGVDIEVYCYSTTQWPSLLTGGAQLAVWNSWAHLIPSALKEHDGNLAQLTDSPALSKHYVCSPDLYSKACFCLLIIKTFMLNLWSPCWILVRVKQICLGTYSFKPQIFNSCMYCYS